MAVYLIAGWLKVAMIMDPAGKFWMNKLLRRLTTVSSEKYIRSSCRDFLQMYSGILFVAFEEISFSSRVHSNKSDFITPQYLFTCQSDFS